MALFIVTKGRGYYLAAAYPMLIVMGSVAGALAPQAITALARRG